MTLPVALVGVDFRRASTRWRAALALDDSGRRDLHAALAAQGGTSFAQVATCNRTEWIAVGQDPEWIGELLRAQAIERLGVIGKDGPRPYVHTGEAAARHLLRVAVGLESLARGEAHVAGQVHDAFAQAREEGTACGVLNVLETVVGRAVRRVGRVPQARTSSAGMHKVVADALLREEVPEGAPVLVVGMGAIGRRVADRLASRHPVVRVNRTPRDGWVPLDAVLREPPPHAAVVLCTGAPDAIWTPAQVRPETRVIIDLGSPPQVDPAVRERVRLVDLDALVAVEIPPGRVVAVDEALDIGLDDLRRALGVRALRDLVRTSRVGYEHLTREGLPTALDRVALSAADRQHLELELREMFKAYAGSVLDAVEALALENGG